MSLDVSLSMRVQHGNITHNLGKMASEVKVLDSTLYQYLWRPDELYLYYAEDLVEPLSIGLLELLDNPKKYKKFNPENGWGDYEGLVRFTRELLEASKLHPAAYIEVSR